MYTAYKDFTLSCPFGETGATYTASATASSIITQADADKKALGMAKALAVEYIECSFPPGETPVVFYSVSVTASAAAQAGYQPRIFTVSLEPATVYSTVSQAAADAGALLSAQKQAEQARDAGQIPVFLNLAQTWSGTCGGGYLPYSVEITVAAGTHSSTISQSDASQAALASAKAQVAALLSTNCLILYYSTVQSYTATCSGGLVGTPITVVKPEKFATSTVSQADANATALAGATAAANALLSCAAGYYNTEQSASVSCVGVFGPNWVGSNQSATVPAGNYFSTVSQADANAIALTAATDEATSKLSCSWGGGIEP